MKCKFYLDYSDYSKLNFEVNDTYYTDKTYVDMLYDSVDNHIKFDYSNIDNNLNYATCEGALLDENNNSIIDHSINQHPFTTRIFLDFNTIDEEFEEELRSWVSATSRIKNSSVDDSWKRNNLPLKTLKFEINDVNGTKLYGSLNKCTILEISSNIIKITVDNLIILKDLK